LKFCSVRCLGVGHANSVHNLSDNDSGVYHVIVNIVYGIMDIAAHKCVFLHGKLLYIEASVSPCCTHLIIGFVLFVFLSCV